MDSHSKWLNDVVAHCENGVSCDCNLRHAAGGCVICSHCRSCVGSLLPPHAGTDGHALGIMQLLACAGHHRLPHYCRPLPRDCRQVSIASKLFLSRPLKNLPPSGSTQSAHEWCDAEAALHRRYGMLDPSLKDKEGLPLTIRAVFIVGMPFTSYPDRPHSCCLYSAVCLYRPGVCLGSVLQMPVHHAQVLKMAF